FLIVGLSMIGKRKLGKRLLRNRSCSRLALFGRLRSRTISAEEIQTDRQNCANNDDVDPSLAAGTIARGVSNFGAFDPFGRRFKSPCNYKRNWKSDYNQRDDEAHDPVRNFEDWKDLRDSLRKRPACDRISYRDFVNVAPLQLGEEVHWQVKASGPRSGVG